MKLCKKGLHQYEPRPGGCPECKKITGKKWESTHIRKRRIDSRDVLINKCRREVANLTNRYVKKQIMQATLILGVKIKASQIPVEIVEAKRKQLLIKRLIKELKNENA